MLGIVGVTVEGCEKFSAHASEAPDLNLATLHSFASTSNETFQMRASALPQHFSRAMICC